MVKLLIVRHGQTEWNTLHKMQGQKDSPLTDTGRELARRLGARLADTRIDGVLCSPLKRAMDTAEIIMAGRNVEIRPEARLKELNLGKWEGEHMPTIEQRYPIDFEAFWENPNRYMEIRGGELYDELLARTKELLAEMADSRDGTYLMVTHAIALRSIRQNVLGIGTDRSRMSMPSCCLCEIDIENGKYELKIFGDKYHHEDSIMSWWHGSPEKIDTLRAGSTITRLRPLAEAFSHKPSRLEIDTDGTIEHNGTANGRMYRISEMLSAGDVIAHPRSTMPLTYEFLTTRDIKVEFTGETGDGSAKHVFADNPGLTLKI